MWALAAVRIFTLFYNRRMPFRLGIDYKPRGDQATAIEALLRGLHDGEQHQVLLGVTGSGKTFTMAKVIETSESSRAGAGAQQDARRAVVSGVQDLLSVERGRVLRQLLRLLPARSLHSRRRRLHRKRSHHQRRAGQAAPVGHALAVRAARLRHHRQRQLHLRSRLARSVLRDAADARKRPEDRARGNHRALVNILYERNEGDFKRGTFRVRGDVIEIVPHL